MQGECYVGQVQLLHSPRELVHTRAARQGQPNLQLPDVAAEEVPEHPGYKGGCAEDLDSSSNSSWFSFGGE